MSDLSSLEQWHINYREKDLTAYKLGGFPIDQFDIVREQFKLHIERKGQNQAELNSWSSAFLQYCKRRYSSSQHSFLMQQKPKPPTPKETEKTESLSKEELKARREVGLKHIEKMKKLFGKR